MKRVHNSSPEPLDSEQPVKGTKKRKKSEASESYARKRSAPTSPTEDKVAPVVVTLEEQFQQRKQHLISAVHHIDDPNDPEVIQRLVELNHILKDMASASHRITSATSGPRMGRTPSQQSG